MNFDAYDMLLSPRFLILLGLTVGTFLPISISIIKTWNAASDEDKQIKL